MNDKTTSRPHIIAVDFDGTLCENRWPEIGEPYPGILAFCIAMRALGAKLILYTCRTGKELHAAVEWCRKHHLEFDAVNENLPETIAAFGGDTRKIVADQYIDDKAADMSAVDRIGIGILQRVIKGGGGADNG